MLYHSGYFRIKNPDGETYPGGGQEPTPWNLTLKDSHLSRKDAVAAAKLLVGSRLPGGELVLDAYIRHGSEIWEVDGKGRTKCRTPWENLV